MLLCAPTYEIKSQNFIKKTPRNAFSNEMQHILWMSIMIVYEVFITDNTHLILSVLSMAKKVSK